MGKKVDPREFLLNTNYEMDKIIYFKSGELELNTPIEFAHNLAFTPLLFGVCAFNSDFSDSRPIPYVEVFGGGVGYSCTAISYSDKIHLEYSNLNQGPQPKMYYRIFGFEPSDSHSSTPITNKYAKQFIINTDYNYCKLFKKGVIDCAEGATETVAHNLGYIPQTIIWQESNGAVVIPNRISLPRPNYPATLQAIDVTDTAIVFHNGPSECKYHYRIYYDEA